MMNSDSEFIIKNDEIQNFANIINSFDLSLLNDSVKLIQSQDYLELALRNIGNFTICEPFIFTIRQLILDKLIILLTLKKKIS
jgi:hypothetical protein